MRRPDVSEDSLCARYLRALPSSRTAPPPKKSPHWRWIPGLLSLDMRRDHPRPGKPPAERKKPGTKDRMLCLEDRSRKGRSGEAKSRLGVVRSWD